MEMTGKYTKYEPIFGSWYLSKLLGKGSFGEVYEITREEYGTTYKAALKIISVPQENDDIKSRMTEDSNIDTIAEYYEGVLKEIVNENEIMSKLKGNTNIVSYEDHQIIPHEDEIGYDILIRMELLTPLLDKMLEKRLEERDVVKLGIDICKALELCHKKNIIHRDIKPQNIFISDNGDYKLGDFGIAKTIEKASGGMSKKGTYKYMAPEVFKGEDYDSTVDIYSLGIVMYSLLNGNRGPFLPPPPAKINHNDEENARLRRFRGEVIPPAQNASVMLSYIIGKACKANPAERYETAEQMRMDLESFLSNYDPLQAMTSGEAANEETVYEETAYDPSPHINIDPLPPIDQPWDITNETEIRRKRILLIAAGCVVLCVVICAAIIIAILSGREKDSQNENSANTEIEVDSSSLDLAALMTEPVYGGYSGSGYIDGAITIDETKRQIVINSAKNDDEKEKLQQLLSEVVYTADISDGLSNGDVIRIRASYNSDLANEMKKQITGTETTVTVAGLDEFPSYLESATEFNGHYYKVVNESLYWDDARDACERDNGHLATITGAEEQAMIVSLIEDTGSKYNYWLGGEDAGHEGSWTWITGEPWSYSNWRENQPDNGVIGEERAQDYLAICMVSKEDTGRYGKWWDNSNDGVSKNYVQAPYYKDTQYYGYVIEWDGIDQ